MPPRQTDELAKLVREQARDDARRRLDSRHGEVRECDRPRRDPDRPSALDDMADPRADDPADAAIPIMVEEVERDDAVPSRPPRRRPLRHPRLLGTVGPWGAEQRDYDPRVDVCPGCDDRIRRGELCIVCSRVGPADTPVAMGRPSPRASNMTPYPLAGGLGLGATPRATIATSPATPREHDRPPRRRHRDAKVMVKVLRAFLRYHAGQTIALRESQAGAWIAVGIVARS